MSNKCVSWVLKVEVSNRTALSHGKFCFLGIVCCRYLNFVFGVTYCYQLSRNVSLFSCNPIGQLCLGGPGYSSCALIFDFPKETELLWLRGRWTKFQSHLISDFISVRLSGKLIQRLFFNLVSLTPSLFVTEFIFSWPFELDGVGGIALCDAITSFFKRCYELARETGAKFLLQNSPSLARKRIIPNRSFPSYHKPLFQREPLI